MNCKRVRRHLKWDLRICRRIIEATSTVTLQSINVILFVEIYLQGETKWPEALIKSFS